MRISSVLTAVSLFFMFVPMVSFSADFNSETNQYIQELETQAKKQDRTFTGFDPERGKKIFF